ncbi:GNAT family N-acetyltransferase [Sorangium sp. So ce1036]|uniref:GNAT family N-acetyltransferase n=1 Tax=Sorangium sp. So ce1036 TaxID=3133328 RepID=UPI003F01E1AC
MSERLDVRVLNRREELEALREPWDALWQRCPAATTFQRPEWLLPWCRELGPEEVLALVLRSPSAQGLVGLAPLAIHRIGAERVVALLGAGITDYNDVLAAPGYERAVAEAVLAFLGERAGAWDVADLHDLRGSSPLLAADAPPGWSDEVEKHEACPRVVIPEGAGPDDLFSPGMRARIARARKRLARAGALRVEVAGADSLGELLDALFANHRARWISRGEGGVLDEALRPFHRAAAAGLCARGALRLFGLRLDGRIIASLYGLAERDGLASYITGFDPEFAWYSPGLVMLASAIEHTAREGARTVDFLRGREPYKYAWGAVDRWTYRRRLRHRGARGAAAVEGAARPDGRGEVEGAARASGRGEVEGAMRAVMSGEVSPEVGLVRLLGAAGDLAAAERALEAAQAGAGEPAARLEALRRCVAERRAACATVAEMLGAHRDGGGAGEVAPTRTAALFDALCARSEEASVAAYSLGDPALLDRATREVVELLERWGLLDQDRAILQIGCGIGRFEAALAPRVREAWGLDVAPRMIEAARRRCAGLSNVVLAVSSGVDLRDVPSARFDLVYAVDSFPYLVGAGAAVVDRHVADARRVLVPGGELVLLGYSYRGDPARDAADVARLAARHGFDVLVSGERPFSLWDGLAYRLRRIAHR